YPLSLPFPWRELVVGDRVKHEPGHGDAELRDDQSLRGVRLGRRVLDQFQQQPLTQLGDLHLRRKLLPRFAHLLLQSGRQISSSQVSCGTKTTNIRRI